MIANTFAVAIVLLTASVHADTFCEIAGRCSVGCPSFGFAYSSSTGSHMTVMRAAYCFFDDSDCGKDQVRACCICGQDTFYDDRPTNCTGPCFPRPSSLSSSSGEMTMTTINSRPPPPKATTTATEVAMIMTNVMRNRKSEDDDAATASLQVPSP